MKKIICGAIACIISSISYSDNLVSIEPLSKLDIPESFLKEQEEAFQQQKLKGYSELESGYPKILLGIGKNGVPRTHKNYGESDTNMKHSISEVKVGFKFKTVPDVAPKDIIGFSPRAAYVNSKWTGITEFFNDKNIGTCKYSATNMKLSNGSARIDPSAVRYDVNNKPGDIFVQGSINSGFLYTVSWFNNEYSYILECANMNYDKAITDKAIELARIIDKNNDHSPNNCEK